MNEGFYLFLKKCRNEKFCIDNERIYQMIRAEFISLNKFYAGIFSGKNTSEIGTPRKFFWFDENRNVFIDPEVDLELVYRTYTGRISINPLIAMPELLGTLPVVLSGKVYNINSVRASISAQKYRYTVREVANGDIEISDVTKHGKTSMAESVKMAIKEGKCKIPDHVTPLSIKNFMSNYKGQVKLIGDYIMRMDVYYFERINDILNSSAGPEIIESASKYGWHRNDPPAEL